MGRDLQSNLEFIELYNAAFSADAYSKYIDTRGLRCLGFLVTARMSAGDATNFVTPKVYGSNTTTAPETFSEYTACDAAELLDAFSALNNVANFTQFVALREDRLYRYYCLFLDETLTAAGDITVHAVFEKMLQPSEGVVPTTGAVT